MEVRNSNLPFRKGAVPVLPAVAVDESHLRVTRHDDRQTMFRRHFVRIARTVRDTPQCIARKTGKKKKQSKQERKKKKRFKNTEQKLPFTLLLLCQPDLACTLATNAGSPFGPRNTSSVVT